MNERRRVRIRRDCPRFGVRQCVSGLPGSLISGASCTVVGSSGAGYRPDRVERREVLRRLFILRLLRIDRDSEAPQRGSCAESDPLNCNNRNDHGNARTARKSQPIGPCAIA